MTPVVYFLVLTSIVVHGISITLVKGVMETRKLAQKHTKEKEGFEMTPHMTQTTSSSTV